MVKPEIDKKRGRNQWTWAVGGALIAVLFAIALTRTSHFPRTDKFCNCSRGSHKYSGIVEDCCCEYETVDHLNEEVLHPMLQELVKTPFFRYFKVKLWCDCPFWPEDGMCRLRDCSVCECPEAEFPETFKKPFSRSLPSDDIACQEGMPEAVVDRTIDAKAFRGWIVIDNPWTNDDETDNAEMTYVNLQLNPERYTGYTGPSVRRIWDAIYTENCPKCDFGTVIVRGDVEIDKTMPAPNVKDFSPAPGHAGSTSTSGSGAKAVEPWVSNSVEVSTDSFKILESHVAETMQPSFPSVSLSPEQRIKQNSSSQANVESGGGISSGTSKNENVSRKALDKLWSIYAAGNTVPIPFLRATDISPIALLSNNVLGFRQRDNDGNIAVEAMQELFTGDELPKLKKSLLFLFVYKYNSSEFRN